MPLKRRCRPINLSGIAAEAALPPHHYFCGVGSSLHLSPMAQRPSKKTRILQLRGRCPNQRALSAVVSQLRDDPSLQALDSRQKIQRATDDLWARVGQSHVVQLNGSDGTFTWATLSLRRAFEFLAVESHGYLMLLVDLYRRAPCTPDAPWELILNFDEAVPGNVLMLGNRRKMWTIMVSIKQFGPHVLQHDAAWLPIACLRSDKAKTLRGAFSGAMAILLADWCVQNPTLQLEGLLLPVGAGGAPRFIFIKFGNTLSDEAALKAFWCGKGASGLMPCWHCWVTSVGADGTSIADFDVTGGMRDIRCTNLEEFQLIDDEARYVQADVLAQCRGALGVGQFQELERCYGLSYNSHAVLWDLRLRHIVLPLNGSRYDCAHCLFCNGWVNEELDDLLLRLKAQVGVGFPELRVFFGADWRTATCINGRVDNKCKVDPFTEARERHFNKTQLYRPNASELLHVVPLMAHFLQTVPGIRAQLPSETASFLAMDEAGTHQPMNRKQVWYCTVQYDIAQYSTV